jgi:hypothetical protein
MLPLIPSSCLVLLYQNIEELGPLIGGHWRAPCDRAPRVAPYHSYINGKLRALSGTRRVAEDMTVSANVKEGKGGG